MLSFSACAQKTTPDRNDVFNKQRTGGLPAVDRTIKDYETVEIYTGLSRESCSL